VIISAGVSMGIIVGTLGYTTDEVAAGLQDSLIGLEMCIAAIMHHQYFSYTDFYGPKATEMYVGNGQSGGLERESGANSATDKEAAGGLTSSGRGAIAGAGYSEVEAGGAEGDGTTTTIRWVAAEGGGRAGSSDEPESSSLLPARARGSTADSTAAGGAGGSGVGRVVKQLRVQEGGKVTVVGARKTGVAAAVVDMLPVDVMADTAEHLKVASAAAGTFIKRKIATKGGKRKPLSSRPGPSASVGSGREVGEVGGGGGGERGLADGDEDTPAD
jgi:hypothetical protein